MEKQKKRDKKFKQKQSEEKKQSTKAPEEIQKKVEDKKQSKASLTKEILSVASKDDKLSLAKMLANEIVSSIENNYSKLDDMLMLWEDTDIDVITLSIKQITLVFCDILPDYKIREDLNTKKEGKVMLSKEVKKLREQEMFLLESFRKFLQVLETFSKFNSVQLKYYYITNLNNFLITLIFCSTFRITSEEVSNDKNWVLRIILNIPKPFVSLQLH